MRRVTTLTAAGIATAALALTATACGASSTDSTGSSSSSGGAGMKVGVAYDVGGRGDHSFNDSAARGLDKATKEFGGTPKELTAKTTDTESDREQHLSDLASAGYNPVVAVGFAYADAIKAVAPKFPKTNFGIVDSVVPGSNVDSMTFASPESSYLAGVAAALKSKTGHVGFIGGVDNALIKGFQAGFEQGVKDTKPADKVTVQYLSTGSDISGFSSPDKGKSAANGMLSQGIDVIYTAAGSSGSGAIEAVHGKAGAWAIGVDSDQYQDPGLAAYKSSILTSAVKNVDLAVYELIKSVHDKKPISGNRTYGLAEGGVSLATSGGYITDIQAQLDAARKKIVNGQVKVKSTP
ncbi:MULTISPECIES: BMP family lipoprotein [Streptomycetaceae]|uniref:Lipoprotein n=1 Tax=Streptantibioticus cattleyicolor (strain ATCC 35852 / DSM 46488 / JCM 4925 / NBRC 14057 / NRRL 8057) TaxID=1003195 RepID=F8K168_STREN|nr:BMP family ABC transporter substrate-binding protein [Streptantibioticus cattleyicolor]AEW96139.1 lipoprotein [Streptantibioticus cattleyicolor NRRL 8057 = DSM 46488]MYS60666.1 BMP family ABC transporter substrate-binding protein [Streptomyces sp. SID5468]CCB76477.1 Lipoprotein [Streptantibioticus cattleyicolor NRRL 8057 = DSM 46488]